VHLRVPWNFRNDGVSSSFVLADSRKLLVLNTGRLGWQVAMERPGRALTAHLPRRSRRRSPRGCSARAISGLHQHPDGGRRDRWNRFIPTKKNKKLLAPAEPDFLLVFIAEFTRLLVAVLSLLIALPSVEKGRRGD
jgi:hypothetical protein